MIEIKNVQKYLHRLTPQPTSLKPDGAIGNRIKCVLFDIYGTLFISGSGDISLADKKSPQSGQINQLLTRYGINKTAKVLLDDFYQAIKARHAQLRDRGVEFPEVRIDQIWTTILPGVDIKMVKQFALEFELIVNPVYPMPNLQKMLSTFQRQGILMGLISNAQFYTPYLFRWFLSKNFEELGIDPELVFYSYRFEVAKPSPKLFRLAAEKLGVRGILSTEVLYVGNDMLNDIYPAKTIGFQTVLFAGDRRSLRLRAEDPRCTNLSADVVVTNLIQLTRHVQ
ncbi:MAG: HAD family hydrolase [Desulfobacterales bacterium]|jgi:putative hydrolase of the HAD superfamily